MKKTFALLLTFSYLSGFVVYGQIGAAIQPDAELRSRAEGWLEAGGLSFEENKGQVQGVDAGRVRFTVKAPGIDVFILADGIAYQYKKTHYPEGYQALQKEGKPDNAARIAQLAGQIKTETFRMDALLEGANTGAEVVAEQAGREVNHYYQYDVTGVRNYQKITYKNIYPDIDWQLFFKDGKLVHEFVVHPGGDPEEIRFRYAHHEGLSLQKDGSLQMKSGMGDITDQVPISFQDGKEIATRYVLNGNTIRFALGTYDRTRPLLIDPTLQWATYYGGTGYDMGHSCAVDGLGNVYLAGETFSASGIASGGHQNSYGEGSGDAFLAKFSSSGERQWASYYGGTGSDAGLSCAVDGSENVYLAGYTTSASGIASGGHQNSYGEGSGDAFLVKFSSAGARQWATYYGGTGYDFGRSCAVDGSGNVYLAGETFSASGIASDDGHQNLIGGGYDAFLVKFSKAGARRWATYYGGTVGDYSYSCTVDGSENVYLVGYTTSASGIASDDGHQNLYGGGDDAFLVKFSSAGARQWATYYGGTGGDLGYSCAVDGSGNVYLAGYTLSASGIASGGHQTSYGGDTDAFLVKFSSDGARQWATYYGGTSYDIGRSCAVDGSGNVYLAGFTASASGIASGGHQNSYGGSTDAFLAKFSSAGERQWATYYGGTSYGGTSYDTGHSCAVDGLGNVYLAGYTSSSSGIASGGHQNSYGGGGYDAFLAKIAESVLPVKLGSFRATGKEGRAYISWTTTEEAGFDRFEVQRSLEGKSGFTTVGKVSAKGVDGKGSGYSFTDHDAPQGRLLYYRLKMVDFDGTSELSRIESLKLSEVSASVYPNPAGSFLKVSANEAIRSMELISMSGHGMNKTRFAGNSKEETLELGNTPSGVYQVKIEGVSGVSVFRKVVIGK